MSEKKEITVTPEMADAGAAILVDFEWGWADPEDYAVRIFRAMAAVAVRDGRQDGELASVLCR